MAYVFICTVIGVIFIAIFLGIRTTMSDARKISVDFEVHGSVQGVFFRDYTRRTSTQNGCVGWVKNTNQDTVVGQIQGPKKNIDFMKHWLSSVGSPMSTIKRCDFSNEKTIEDVSYKNFTVR
ncbi:acylphosphatase-2-like [Haliotis rufescens]|uniref:acylphosphatase-2-like n=1 Tax=Haliotis rufescens TaxID=6454 RepID=UPI001EAFA669|nr:acylphosphatase-2-like [Haliotis rufescens]